jgi:septal ring factor EnvC (AmiA/AmiB activator)
MTAGQLFPRFRRVKLDCGATSGYESWVPKTSRVPSAVGAIPVVGDLVKKADSQAQWLQEFLEQNARLAGELPATIKTLTDSLERFNQTVVRLDKVVSRIEDAAAQLVAPLEQMAPKLDRIVAAATDTQKQVAILTATLERIIGLMGELPGAGLLRRLAGGRADAAETDDPDAAATRGRSPR